MSAASLVAVLALLGQAAPDGPPSAADLDYDARLRSSMASAQAFQGTMAGGWTLTDARGARLALQLNDRDGLVDGAWRDLRRSGALDASGFVTPVERSADRLVLRLGEALLTLRPAPDGWTGDLTSDHGPEPVTLRRSR